MQPEVLRSEGSGEHVIRRETKETFKNPEAGTGLCAYTLYGTVFVSPGRFICFILLDLITLTKQIQPMGTFVPMCVYKWICLST